MEQEFCGQDYGFIFSTVCALSFNFVIQLLSEPDKQDCRSACPKFD